MASGLTPRCLSRRAFAAGTAAAAIGAGLAARGAGAQDATPTLPSPPVQPATGPGGADYTYDEVVVTASGEAPGDFWLFQPAAPRAGTPSADAQVPVVIFIGTCYASKPIAPDLYRSWIDHLVRRGAVVIYPLYSPTEGMSDDTKSAVSAALTEMGSGDHVPVDLTRVAVVGDRCGGPLAMHHVAAPPAGLPPPVALMAVQPEATVALAAVDIGAISATTHVLLVGGEEARQGDYVLERVWTELARVNQEPPAQRAYVELQSDAHGSPALVADDMLVNTDYPPQGDHLIFLDALDWYGTWRLLDALMTCAFEGEWCEYAFGNTPEQRYMGTWSDGVPVAEAVIAGESGTPTP